MIFISGEAPPDDVTSPQEKGRKDAPTWTPGRGGGSGNQGFHSFVFYIGNFHQNKLDTCSKGVEDVEGPDWPRGV